MTYFQDLFRRLRLARVWVILQFALTPVLILVGLLWTRLPEKHIWQVALSLLLPILLGISALELQAGAMRRFAADDGRRVKLVWGAVALLVWLALGILCWVLLDWCDDRIYLWAGYLNSKAPVAWRARLLTFDHLQRWLTCVEWVLRWVVVPGKIIPYAVASAQGGWRIPWGRVIRIVWNWRWWPAMALASFMAVWLPGRLFAGDPHGAVTAQVWAVGLKLAATYLLAVGAWVLLLAWAAVLFGRQLKPSAEDTLVAVPVLAGPKEGAHTATAELPPPDGAGGSPELTK